MKLTSNFIFFPSIPYRKLPGQVKEIGILKIWVWIGTSQFDANFALKKILLSLSFLLWGAVFWLLFYIKTLIGNDIWKVGIREPERSVND